MLVDFYSILGISYPSNFKEIKSAYDIKKESLGKGSSNSCSPNYQARVDVELAYRVLGASYIMKTAYDEEYEKARKEWDNYVVKYESLLSDIERERNFVVNQILNPNFKIPENSYAPKKGCVMTGLGCLGKGFLICLCLVVFAQVKKCSRKSARELYEKQSVYTSTESADSKLRRFAAEKMLPFHKK